MEKVKASGITTDQISNQLATLGESLPVISDTTINNQSYGLVNTLTGSTIDDIKNLQFKPQPQGGNSAAQQGSSSPVKSYKLSDLGTATIDYQFSEKDAPKIGLKSESQSKVFTPLVLIIKSVENTDQGKLNDKIIEKVKSYDDVVFANGKNDVGNIDSNKVLITENFTVNDQNKDQVNEVIGGLIGSPLSFVKGPAANIGWLLGGIQLVFLVMLAFVSWRAAIIAAISIPLSLSFSTIYLYFIGESLNTLVLFSLVLVIGLVVDPALVILEAIQRKIDVGLKGNAAVLAAVKDVGNGLFLATVTNIIVFLPFGLISGLLGKIFAYIPLTVIPATIGSYIVPLVFLAWLGGLILKPNKNTSSSEEDNLWPIAKWLIKTNSRILHGSRVVRLVIVVLGLLIPIGIAYYYTSSGQVKQVQFASNDNVNEMTLSGNFLPEIRSGERDVVISDVVDIITKNKNVLEVYPYPSNSQSGLSYFIELKKATDRNEKSTVIAKNIDDEIQNKYGENSSSPKFFDIKVDLSQTGPPSSNYQVTIAVNDNDLKKLQTGSLEVDKTLKNVCFGKDRKVTISEECSGGEKIVTKVDNGYTNKLNKQIEVLVDRQKLQEKQLVIADNPSNKNQNPPMGILVNQKLKQLFTISDDQKVGKINIENEETEIVIDKSQADPTTLDEIKNTTITNTVGQDIKLSDIATIREVSAKTTIQRVKGETLNIVQARLKDGYTDQGSAALVTNAVVKYYEDEANMKNTGLEKGSIKTYSEGSTAENQKSFVDLITTLILAILLTYIVLAVFFQSFAQPLVILYTIPLTFIGMFPALAYLGGGQIGFLEIIGIIILIGVVENVAIFLIDAARTKINEEGWDEKRAISFASGVRLRSVIMTKFTAIASLAPLAVLSVFYRSIAIVIMFGLLTSGFTSLFTTPVLFIFFKWLSKQFTALKWYNKILFFPLFPIYIIGMAIMDKPNKNKSKNSTDVVDVDVTKV
jgi:HAE1 family hydrophobic/amphiphilic exporter-1